MPGPANTNSAKNAKLVKQGHTTTGKFGDDPKAQGKVPSAREISPKG
jgi:hypothetical protein